MKTRLSLVYLLLALSIGLTPVRADNSQRQSGELNLAVYEEDGTPVHEAHVYIYGINKAHLIDGQDVRGSAQFLLSPGRYRVYAAITRNGHGYLDHYASHEALVRVASDDRVSVILTLHKVENPIDYIPESALKKLQIDPELAKYLN